jgi:hypothetical protein
MYYYYFQSTRGYQPWWKMYLTRLQISQLFSFVVLGTIAFAALTSFRFRSFLRFWGRWLLTLKARSAQARMR